VGWIAVLALSVVVATMFKGTFTADDNMPGSDSQAAGERLGQGFAGRSGEAVGIVWKAEPGARSPAVAERIDRLLDKAGRLPGVVPGTTAQTAEVSRDGLTAIARLPLDRPAAAVAATTGERIAELLAEASGRGVTVAANGTVPGLEKEAAMTAELIGVAVAAVVLLATFGTVVAAGLPLLLALVGVAIAVMLRLVLAAAVTTPDWAVQASIMIGLGVGIDYALLVLTRYRAATRAGSSPRAATAGAMSTAGHCALVAGGTVVIALMGLVLMRLPYLNGVALGSSLAVLVVMAATATLLPALIGLPHERIDRLQLGRLGTDPADPDRTRVARFAGLIDRRPVVGLVASLAVLAVLAAPLTGIRFGFPDAGNEPAESTTRVAYDLEADGFGAGANGPLIAVASTGRPGRRGEGGAAARRHRAPARRRRRLARAVLRGRGHRDGGRHPERGPVVGLDQAARRGSARRSAGPRGPARVARRADRRHDRPVHHDRRAAAAVHRGRRPAGLRPAGRVLPRTRHRRQGRGADRCVDRGLLRRPSRSSPRAAGPAGSSGSTPTSPSRRSSP